MNIKPDRFLRIAEVVKITGIGRSSIYARMQKNDFPSQIKLSERTAVWTESSISDWIEEQKQKAGVA